MPLTPLSGILGRKRAAHLLRRATFGPAKSQIDDMANMTATEALAELFMTDLPDPLPPVDLEQVEFIPNDSNTEDTELREYVKSWYLGQMLGHGVPANQVASYSVREKITFLFHTIFTTIESKVASSRSLYYQNSLFRNYSFDNTVDPDFNFKTLSKKVCVENAMLRFLDGDSNVKGSPNENFGREFFELFSIGRGLEGTLPPLPAPGDYFNYTEQDVQAAALVFSGFSVDRTYSNIDLDTELPRGVVRGGAIATSHDNTTKQFSDRFGSTIVEPDPLLLEGGLPTEASVLDEISQLVEMIYTNSNEAAKNICRKIYRFYVYYNIDQALDDDVITSMADTFVNSGYKIQAVLEDLFASQHFYEASGAADDDNFGGIIKSPLDLTLGALKSLEVTIPDYATDLENYYLFMGNLKRKMQDQGMSFYQPAEVAGYPAYHQFPVFNRNWISTNYLTRRYQFIQQLVSNANMMDPGEIGVDLLAFTRDRFSAVGGNPQDLIIEFCKYLLPVNDNLTFDVDADDTAEISAERLNYFMNAFLYSPDIDPNDPKVAWTDRWNNNADYETMTGQLESLINAMLQSPEYQLF